MRLLCTVVLGAALSLMAEVAVAQSMSPMRGEIQSFTDSFAVRVHPSNPYKHRIKIDVRVYDQNFQPVKSARVTPSQMMLASEASRPVLVVIPFDGNTERKVRVCAESIPFPGQQTQIKAQICGKFLGRKR